ncbi:extracellular solute-binding protein [Lentisphaera profundi]|uniref:Extracellular solute-binding protein n=1 Tax=Lentisphaera profundi TaxID=1658616 RepID=A0ABY7VSE3_9BACT|nr:extracellular solute-binding protein [Lentisphaera profundi]WDE95694.1 extracellular solute-binding protein [Lentisphaera profundi]
MKKYLTVVIFLFFASCLTIFFLAMRKNTFLKELRIIPQNISLPPSFPISKEQWPENLVWENGSDQEIFSDSKATKGGTWNSSISSFPPNFRQVGPESNSGFRGFLDNNDMGLIEIHPVTQKIIPALASEWAVNEDRTMVYFKIDPDASWDDGVPVTADDFIFRLKAMRSPGIIAPWYNQYYSSMISDILKFGDKRIAIKLPSPMADTVLKAAMRPLPYHHYGALREIRKTYPLARAISYLERDHKEIPENILAIQKNHVQALEALSTEEEKPKEPSVEITVEDVEANWIKNHNWQIQPRTGPYNIDSYIKGKEVIFKRNQNWWAKDKKYFKNRYNVDFIRYSVIRDNNLAYEKFKLGYLDQFPLLLPNYWHSKAKYLDPIDRGYMQKIWFYTQKPEASYQISFNLDNPRLKDLNLRLGIIYSLNIQNLLDTVLYGDYERSETFHEGYGDYSNPNIKARRFDANKAVEYFKKAGYTKIGRDGIRVNDKDEKLRFKVLYAAPHHTERILALQNEAKKLGLQLDLDSFDSTAVFKAMLNKEHEIAWHGWGAGFRPQYRGQFHQTYAHKKQNNNLSNLDNTEVSEMIDKYRFALDTKTRIELAHQIEKALFELAPAVPTYKVPYFRQGLWRWVRYPSFIATPSSEMIMDDLGLFWIDTELKKEIQEKMVKKEIIYDIPPLIKNTFYRGKL